MKASELDGFCAGLIPGRRNERSCDGFKAGDPSRELRRIGVTWMATNAVLDEAERLGLDGIVTHEPTFFEHMDPPESRAASGTARAKAERIGRLGLVIIRLHDCWDDFPEWGIGDATARALGWRNPEKGRVNHVYAIRPTTVKRLAQAMSRKLGCPNPRVFGDPGHRVTKVGLCWGHTYLGAVVRCVEAGADCVVAGELAEWQGPQYVLDSGRTMIFAGHCSTEKQGMRSARDFLARRFPEAEFVYLDVPEAFGPPVVSGRRRASDG